MSLTRFVIEKLPRAAGTAAVKKQWEAQEIESKFNNSDYAKKRAQVTKRRNLNDFQRFKVMRLRKQVSFLKEGSWNAIRWELARRPLSLQQPHDSVVPIFVNSTDKISRPVSRSARPLPLPRPRKYPFLETTIQPQA